MVFGRPFVTVVRRGSCGAGDPEGATVLLLSYLLYWDQPAPRSHFLAFVLM